MGLALGQGCATADTSDFTASSPFASAGQPGSADGGDASASDSTGDGADDADANDTGGDADDDGGTPTVGPIDTGDEGADGGAVGSDCCTAHDQGGCADAMIEACVCGQDPVCCDEVWDDVCVESVAGFGCGDCGGGNPPPGGDDGGVPPPQGGACCDPQGMPGCGDMNVAMCVCEVDSYCCETDWDQDCVGLVDELGCGDCGGAMPPAEDGGGGDGSCCMPTGVPGCADPAVMECVCGENEDVFCCLVEWDEVCASEVSEFGCGAC